MAEYTYICRLCESVIDLNQGNYRVVGYSLQDYACVFLCLECLKHGRIKELQADTKLCIVSGKVDNFVRVEVVDAIDN